MLETMRLLFAEEGRVTLQYTMTRVERFQHTWCYQLSCVDASVVGGDFPQVAGIKVGYRNGETGERKECRMPGDKI